MDIQRGKVRLSRNRTQTGKLRDFYTDSVITTGFWIDKSIQSFGCSCCHAFLNI